MASERTTRTVPAKALRFEADVAIGDEEKKDQLEGEMPDGEKKEGEFEGDEEKKAETQLADGETTTEDDEKPDGAQSGGFGQIPVRIKARTSGTASQCFWGPCIHDFAGMDAGKRITVDYCHDPKEVIGFAAGFDASSGELMLTGALTPTAAGDRALEIVNKHKAGVPYQASILMGDDGLVIEEVGAGATAFVNGQNVEGPMTIFRKWRLNGVAICPYGADSNTAIEFSQKRTRTKEAQATVFRAKSAATGAKKTGQDYLDAFGASGGTWFAQGKSWEDAQALHVRELKERASKFEAENQQLRTQVKQLRGSDPVSFQSEKPGAKPTAQSGTKREFSALPEGLARFAAHNASSRK